MNGSIPSRSRDTSPYQQFRREEFMDDGQPAEAIPFIEFNVETCKNSSEQIAEKFSLNEEAANFLKGL